jgi:hypothetical protein
MRSEIQQLISTEVSRQVEARVRQEMTAYQAKQAAADHDFLNRPVREQNMAIFLTRFAQEGSRAVDNGNLATLARATAVSFLLTLVPSIGSSGGVEPVDNDAHASMFERVWP